MGRPDPHLRIRYTPNDPRTAAINEERLEVFETTGVWKVLDTIPGLNLAANTTLRVGVTAERQFTPRPTTVTVRVRDARSITSGVCP